MTEPVAGEPVDAVRFGMLGPLLVVDGSGRPGRCLAGKQRVVLAALLFGSGHVVSAEVRCSCCPAFGWSVALTALALIPALLMPAAERPQP